MPAEVTPSTAAQDNSPASSPLKPLVIEAEPAPAPAPSPPPAESATMTAAPLFRAGTDLGKSSPSPVPPIIPIVRAPDDPGTDDEPVVRDEFAEQLSPSQGQAGGWRGFLSRWGG
jgi:HemY protein